MPDRTRREFLGQTSVAGTAFALSRLVNAQPGPGRAASPPASTFLDLRRPPDAIVAEIGGTIDHLSRSADEWRGGGLVVAAARVGDVMRLRLSAPEAPIARLQVRWHGDMRATRFVLGDAWERGYGDLEWRGLVPDRAMPWYFAAGDGRVTHAYGVRTSPKAFCFWRIDDQGISLVADVRSGGAPLVLGARTLDVCDVVCREGRDGESAFAALHAFCKDMCVAPRRSRQPVYGSNDWYWAYGNNTAESVHADAVRLVGLAPSGANRPFAVIDDGWQPERTDTGQIGQWDRGNAKFGDMARVAAGIRAAGAQPGIWIRPLLAAQNTPDALRLVRDRRFLDPTVADAARKIVDDIERLRGWGFDLVKHDYTTFDLLGRWGFQMGTALTNDGWTFASGPSRTTAEVMVDLYRHLRAAAGESVVIGCNTVSHFSAGVFDVCRIGDDTSGREWSRTRKMGVNTLAFRAVQHGAFYVADADCVGVTNAIPWRFNRQWLDLVARSGTALFVSLAPDAVGSEQARDLRAALALAAAGQPLGEPVDWQRTIWPVEWRLNGHDTKYDWTGPDGIALDAGG